MCYTRARGIRCGVRCSGSKWLKTNGGTSTFLCFSHVTAYTYDGGGEGFQVMFVKKLKKIKKIHQYKSTIFVYDYEGGGTYYFGRDKRRDAVPLAHALLHFDHRVHASRRAACRGLPRRAEQNGCASKEIRLSCPSAVGVRLCPPL